MNIYKELCVFDIVLIFDF